MNYSRLLRADVIAALAAFALLFVMAMDWYSTVAGEDFRRTESISDPGSGALGAEPQRRVQEDASIAAEGEEKNAWQASGAIDRVLLVFLLATAVLALAAAYLRAAGKRFSAPTTPSALAALAAVVAGLLVAYRIIQEPGFDDATVVKPGAPLALVVLGVIALAVRAAVREEEAGTAWDEVRAEDGQTPPHTPVSEP
ncbi:MAG TPA: hypothetical protein VFD31_09645 [Thermoleophilaceae bacterium]|nr:hypothetical protein [Thermoleophilaceae bacterium]